MRTWLVVVGTLLVASAAWAKPLPRGMKVVVKNGRPVVQQGKLSVALRDDDVADYEKITKAELGADGKTVVVTATRCNGTLAGDVTRVALAKIKARLDNETGLAARAGKRYAEAITRFSAAIRQDPDTAAYATNLLAAQLLAGKTELAAQTLATHGKRNPAWFAWRIAVDADLAPAKHLERTADLVATRRGTAHTGKLTERDVMTSPLGSGMAAFLSMRSAPDTASTTDVEIVSLSTGRVLARLPLLTREDACDPCDDAQRARMAERVRLVDGLLASLGFVIQRDAFVDVRNGDPVVRNGVTVELRDDAVSASRGTDERELAVTGSIWAVAFTETALVIKLKQRNLTACDDASSRFAGAALALP